MSTTECCRPRRDRTRDLLVSSRTHIKLSHRGRPASAIIDYSTRWCKLEHVESNTLNNGKLKIFKIIDEGVLFYSNGLDLLPPKPKLSFR